MDHGHCHWHCHWRCLLYYGAEVQLYATADPDTECTESHVHDLHTVRKSAAAAQRLIQMTTVLGQ